MKLSHNIIESGDTFLYSTFEYRKVQDKENKEH